VFVAEPKRSPSAIGALCSFQIIDATFRCETYSSLQFRIEPGGVLIILGRRREFSFTLRRGAGFAELVERGSITCV